jgi:hypothetical protein
MTNEVNDERFFLVWLRDLIVGSLASLLTSLAVVPFAWASQHRGQQQVEAARQEAQAAVALAEQKSVEADQQHALAQRALIEQVANFAGFSDKAGAELMRVTTDAISPEVPKDGWLLIDKKSSSWSIGDIVVFRQGVNNYLGRVVAFDKVGGRLKVARNGEKA